jgi:hypothetical protein
MDRDDTLPRTIPIRISLYLHAYLPRGNWRTQITHFQASFLLIVVSDVLQKKNRLQNRIGSAGIFRTYGRVIFFTERVSGDANELTSKRSSQQDTVVEYLNQSSRVAAHLRTVADNCRTSIRQPVLRTPNSPTNLLHHVLSTSIPPRKGENRDRIQR